jgi:rRNA maturation RNase YbeY
VGASRRISVDVSAARGFGRHRAAVRRAARAALSFACEGPCELSVALVGDDEMRRLNASYRGKDRTTDVLAFSQQEGPGAPTSPLLGDVVVSIPAAERQARERRHTLERELAELLVHGILHLLGYDHERSSADARRMFARAREVMAAVEAVSSDGRRPRHAVARAKKGSSAPRRERRGCAEEKR